MCAQKHCMHVESTSGRQTNTAKRFRSSLLPYSTFPGFSTLCVEKRAILDKLNFPPPPHGQWIFTSRAPLTLKASAWRTNVAAERFYLWTKTRGLNAHCRQTQDDFVASNHIKSTLGSAAADVSAPTWRSLIIASRACDARTRDPTKTCRKIYNLDVILNFSNSTRQAPRSVDTWHKIGSANHISAGFLCGAATPTQCRRRGLESHGELSIKIPAERDEYDDILRRDLEKKNRH